MIRLGTRSSQLAMWQANWTADRLRDLGYEVSLVPISTDGDVLLGSLRELGGDGLFTKRLQMGLQQDEIDLAVHSLKDLPTEAVPGLVLAAVPVREDVRDALVSNQFASIADLPAGAKVGTGSLRRAAQLRWMRPDLQILDLRGNVDTRLRKLDQGQYEAIILACAGLRRLGLEQRITQAIPVDTMLSAVGQGALGLETRDDDDTTRQAVEQLNDPAIMACVQAERSFLHGTRAGCTAPVAALAEIQDPATLEISLRALILNEAGTHRIAETHQGHWQQATQIGAALVQRMMDQGAGDLLTPAGK